MALDTSTHDAALAMSSSAPDAHVQCNSEPEKTAAATHEIVKKKVLLRTLAGGCSDYAGAFESQPTGWEVHPVASSHRYM